MRARDPTQSSKIILIVYSVSFSVLIAGSQVSNQLFPWIQLFLIIVALSLMAVIFYSSSSLIQVSALIIIFSVIIRLFIFEWPPSMIGLDPDRYAVGVIRIIETGELVELKQDVPTYGTLSAFYLLNSQVGIISGLTGRNVLIAIPILMGVLFPLTAIVLTAHQTSYSIKTALAGIIAAVATIGVHFSFWPIVQTIAVLLWCPALICLRRFFNTTRSAYLITILTVSAALVFSHKIPLMIFTGTIGGAIFVGYVKKHIFSGKEYSFTKGNNIWLIFTLSIVALLIQWVILTPLITVPIIKIATLASGSFSLTTKSVPVLNAVPTSPGIINSLLHNLNYLLLMGLSAIASLVLWLKSKGTSSFLLISAAVVPMLIAFIAIIGVTVIAPQRAILFAIPVFSVVIVTSIIKSRYDKRHVTTFLIFTLIIGVQVGSLGLGMSYPGEPRFYLTSSEVNAKENMMKYSDGSVAMEHYYGSKLVDLYDPTAPQRPGFGQNEVPGVIDLSDELLNSTLTEKTYKNILLRKTLTSQYESGGYKLTWNPIHVYKSNRNYNRILDNGQGIGFVNNNESER